MKNIQFEWLSTKQDYRADEDSSLLMVIPTVAYARAWDGSKTITFSWLYWGLGITKYAN